MRSQGNSKVCPNQLAFSTVLITLKKLVESVKNSVEEPVIDMLKTLVCVRFVLARFRSDFIVFELLKAKQTLLE
jgi:hypothetical protein